MALSEDQRAMLRLLLERDQGYGELASLLGIEASDVRSRARAALAEVGGSEPGLELTDYLVGESELSADAAARLASDPEALGLAEKLRTRLQVLVPEADLPALPSAAPKLKETPPKRTAPAPAPAAKPSPTPSSEAAKPSQAQPPNRQRASSRRTLIPLLLGGGLAVILIVLAATGVFKSNSDSDSGSSAAAAAPRQATSAQLEPSDGGDASGEAIFGRVRKTPVLQVQASGLDPSPAGSSYTVWFYHSKKLALRIGSVKVGKSGKMAVQFGIPAEALAFIVNGTFESIDVSLTPDREYKAEVAAAKKQKRLPRYTGTSVLRGKIAGPAVKQ